ncbi:MAG TPA: hypothetical protein VLS93_18005 [Anaeromyxobacteraceae bacterium]|nr:hypothetical protein [Anaeromyxobacteraceae bacterium]
MPSPTVASRRRSRCLDEDGTFHEKSGFAVRFGTLGEGGGAAATDGGAAGTWSFDGETLTLRYEDGDEWEGSVALGESGFIVDDEEVWARR